MRITPSVRPWLLAIGLALTLAPARAAVMTSNVQVTGNGPFDVKYVLGQDVTSIKVEIVNGSGTTVRTFDSAVSGTFQAADMTKGPHSLAGFWNGRNDANAGVPQGDYYARVTTATTVPTAAMTLLSGPTKFAPAPSKTEARNIYGGGVNLDPNSPFHNLAYFGVCTSGNAAGSAGVDAVSADATSLYLAPGSGSYEWVSSSVFTDDVVVSGGQSNNTLRLINPADGSTIGSDLSLGAAPRSVVAVGSSTTGSVFYLNGSTGGVNVWDMAGGYTAQVVPDTEFVITSGDTRSTPQRALAVNKAGTTMWVSGTATAASSPTATLVGFVLKFNKQGDGTWLKDTSFSASIPNYNPASTSINLRGLALSPDEQTLWVSSNSTSASLKTCNQVVGLVPTTGAQRGAAYNYNFYSDTVSTGSPQALAVSSGGNIFVATWTSGNVTGTTAVGVAVLAPPDSGSTDVTRSATFTIGPPVQATVTPYVDPITYHSGTVLWSTDGAANTTVKYGKAAGTLDKTVTSAAAVTDHVALLEGLDYNTTYYYQVTSAATGRVPYTSPVLSFVTNSMGVNTSTVTDVTENSASFTWNSDDVSNSWVNIGTDGVTYPIRIGTDTLTADALAQHAVSIRGLKFGTTYHYKVESGWPGAKPAMSADATFRTLDYVQITSETLAAEAASATLKYDTNITSSAVVHYGTDPASLGSTISVPAGTTHTVSFPGLAAGATYYYNMDLTGGTAAARSTRVSAFTTQVASSTPATITDNSADKFLPGLLTQVTLGGADGLLALDKQSLPGKPVASENKVPLGTRYQGWASTNGYLYVIGGYISGGAATDRVFYAKINTDGSVGAWAETSTLPAPRKVVTGQCIGYNGTVYLVSGDDTDGGIVPDVYFAKQNADGSLQPWQVAPSIIKERDIAAIAIVNGNIVITGGEPNDSGVYSQRTNYLATLKADGSIGAWSEITPPTEAIYLNRTIANAGAFYNIGGLNDTNAINGVRFTSATDTSWVQPNSDLTPGARDPYDPAHLDAWMDSQHYGFASTLAGGKLYAIGGRIATTGAHSEIAHSKIAADSLTTKWVVDAADGTANALPIAIYDNEAYAFNGNIYVSPGRLAGNLENDTIQVVPLVAEASGYAYAGTVESRIIDLGAVSNISHIKVSGSNVSASTVEVRYRFAGSAGDFSDWFTAGPDADITGGARYVQYQLVLKGDGTSTPVVSAVTVNVGPVAVSLPGDVNKDGVVTSDDVKAALRIVGGLTNANDGGVSKQNADVVGDGSVTVEDAVKILRIVTGK